MAAPRSPARTAALSLAAAFLVLGWGCTGPGWTERRAEARRLAALDPRGRELTIAYPEGDEPALAFLETLIRRFNGENPLALRVRLLPPAPALLPNLPKNTPGDILLVSAFPGSEREKAEGVNLLPYVRNFRWGLESTLGLSATGALRRGPLREYGVKTGETDALYSLPVLRDEPRLYLNPGLLEPGLSHFEAYSPARLKALALGFSRRQGRPALLYTEDFAAAVSPSLAGVLEELTGQNGAEVSDSLSAWMEFAGGNLPLLVRRGSAEAYLRQSIARLGPGFPLRSAGLPGGGGYSDLVFRLAPQREEEQELAAWLFVRWFLSPPVLNPAGAALNRRSVLPEPPRAAP
ncbi:MAG: hypothetical protein LBQ61_01805 [Spirochaetales bacterium]|jgi:hypothetical protein|nr:hypothetical protein [Spirochaetales bacterium]